MKTKAGFIVFVCIILLALSTTDLVTAQQFNSDNYITMPFGSETVVLTSGLRNSGFAASYALLPDFEFFTQAFLFWDDEDQQTPQHFNLLLYAKYQFWENSAKTGGGAFFLGMGKSPSYWRQTELVETDKNMWTALPVTFPLFKNTLSLDLMPGATYDWTSSSWGFTYSTRLALYKVIPQTAIVAEVFGTEGQLYSKPEYKIGLRWEPNDKVIPAITYGGYLDGSSGGASFEIGVIIISPTFLKIPTKKAKTDQPMD